MEEPTSFPHLLSVALLHKCNFNCEHCGYIYIGDVEDHNIKPGYQLTWEQVTTAIKESIAIEGTQWNVNYTGGEPTLWKENGKDFMDLLIETACLGAITSYNTNGSYFDDLEKSREYFNRYLDNTDVPLRTFISMDKFHKNFDEEKGRAKSLDNVIKVLNEFPEEKRKLLPTHVIIIVTNEPNSSLPAEMKEYYGQYGITFGEFPMMPIGKAKEIADQLPEKQADLSRMHERRGKGPGSVTLVGDEYFSGGKKVGKLGHLSVLFS
jgi:MoaA/NifB/PqqE/SkfB family radical SAM enzyme